MKNFFFSILSILMLSVMSIGQETNFSGVVQFSRAGDLGYSQGTRVKAQLDYKYKRTVLTGSVYADTSDKFNADSITLSGRVGIRLYVLPAVFGSVEVARSGLYSTSGDKSTNTLAFGGGVNFGNFIASYRHQFKDTTINNAGHDTIRLEAWPLKFGKFAVKFDAELSFTRSDGKYQGESGLVGGGLSYFF